MTARSEAQIQGQAGYALLALLASSSVLLATLALAIPRMAMQSQRLKDRHLIERGEQYQRAIKLYFREHRKYPEDLRDLEETDGLRYLRRLHDDPMGSTGEWRIIHMGTDGRFEDSLLHDLERETPRAGAGFGGMPQAGVFGGQGSTLSPATRNPAGTGREFEGTLQNPQSEPPEGALRTRDSAAPDLLVRDRYSRGFRFNSAEAQPDGPATAAQAGERPDYSRMLPSTIPMDENEFQANNPDAYRQQPGTYRSGDRQAGNSMRGTGMGLGTGVSAGRGPAGGNPLSGGAGASAGQLINRMLTSPRPGGIAGAMGSAAPAVTAQAFERGVAGVASTSEESGVVVYNGKQKYNEWEFVYDYRRDTQQMDSAMAGAPRGTQPGPDPRSRMGAGVGSRGRVTR